MEPTPSLDDQIRSFQQRVERVWNRIVDAGGSSEHIRLIAVSKGHDAHAIRVAQLAGLVDFGENYADELVAKATADHTELPIRWHFQGRLQRNKINKLTPIISYWHTLDSADRITALAQRAPGASVLIQVNMEKGDGESSIEADRSGAGVHEVGDLVALGTDHGLHVLGLMTVAPLDAADQSGSQQRAFHTLSALADRLGLPERSMGMSHDLEDAVRAGATMVRIGSALFGDRTVR
jgi:PLP dependent protein